MHTMNYKQQHNVGVIRTVTTWEYSKVCVNLQKELNVKVFRDLQQLGDEKPVNVTVCRDFHRLSIPASGIELYSETLGNIGKTKGLR